MDSSKIYQEYLNNKQKTIEQLEKKRKILYVSNMVLVLGMIISLIAGPYIYPYGFLIFALLLLLKMTIWQSEKKKWSLLISSIQTIAGWNKFDLNIKYQKNKSIDRKHLDIYDIANGREPVSTKSYELISGELQTATFEASDVSIAYEKIKKISPYPVFTGSWFIFRPKGAEAKFPVFTFKKKISEEFIPNANLDLLADEFYKLQNYDFLPANIKHELVDILSGHMGSIFLFSRESELHLVFENIFINFKPGLKDKITEELLSVNTFESFDKIIKFINVLLNTEV